MISRSDVDRTLDRDSRRARRATEPPWPRLVAKTLTANVRP
ncbi:MAG: hypothetical protein ABI967_14730 [bacterium]